MVASVSHRTWREVLWGHPDDDAMDRLLQIAGRELGEARADYQKAKGFLTHDYHDIIVGQEESFRSAYGSLRNRINQLTHYESKLESYISTTVRRSPRFEVLSVQANQHLLRIAGLKNKRDTEFFTAFKKLPIPPDVFTGREVAGKLASDLASQGKKIFNFTESCLEGSSAKVNAMFMLTLAACRYVSITKTIYILAAQIASIYAYRYSTR